MEIISMAEKKLEKLIDYQASEYHGCDIFKLMSYADFLENINPKNPFIDLAAGVLYAKYKPPNRSYSQSVRHLNLFLKAFPSNENAVLWRLDSATEMVCGTPYVKFLSNIAKGAVESYPTNVHILSAAYRAYTQSVLDVREALKVATRIHYLCPCDGQIRKDIDFLMVMLKDEKLLDRMPRSKQYPKVVKLRRGRFDNKKC